MIILCCTKKVLDDLDIQTEDWLPAETDRAILGNWHVNLIRIMRRKCLLFVNDRTLYSFISFDFKKARKDSLGGLLLEGLSTALRAEGLNEDALSPVLEEAAVVKYAKASNRSILGNMNDLAWRYKFDIEERYGLVAEQLSRVVVRMNRMPQKNLDWRYAIEALAELLPGALSQRASHDVIKDDPFF